MSDKVNTSLMIPDKKFDAIVRQSVSGLALVKENMGDEPLNLADLDRVKMPSGGGSSWSVPSIDGEQNAAEFEGVLIHHHAARVYWDKPMDESAGQPPACSSRDGATGEGNPSGFCHACPLAKFKSGRDGIRPACTEMRVVYVLMNDRTLPIRMTLPPTSIRPLRQYMLALTGASLPFWMVTTKISLDKAKSAKGIAYSTAKLRIGRKLIDSEVEAVREYRDGIKPFLGAAIPIDDARDFQTDESAAD